MVYVEKIKLSSEELRRYNSLLSLDLDECSPYYNRDEIELLGAKTDDYVGIAVAEFTNGNYVTIDLASGDNNYYDNIVLYNKDGQELVVEDCSYELSDFCIAYNGDEYVVELDIYIY